MGSDEPEGEKKKLNDELVPFMRRRSDAEVPRYTTRLHNYVKLQQRRAAAAKRHSDHERKRSGSRKQGDAKEGDAADAEQQENPESGSRVVRRPRRECGHGAAHSSSRSMSHDPQDRCGRRRRRRRRRRSCGRRRRRRRSRRRRRRRSGCRRKRRSRSRRRRRRSCRRRRRRTRRRRRRRRC